MKPNNIKSPHWQEWVEGSGVSPHITALNVCSFEGQDVIELLLGAYLDSLGGESSQWATTPVRKALANYEPLTGGGWGVSGLDPLNDWQKSTIFRFKPDPGSQRIDRDKFGNTKTDRQGSPKKVKYESPKGQPSRAIFLRVSFVESVLTAQRIEEIDANAAQAWKARFRREFNKEGQKAQEILDALARGAVSSEQAIDSSAIEITGEAARGRYSRVIELLLQRPDVPEDEQFWPWVERFDLPIAITEGEKKAAALLTQGIPAIALPGIRNAVRTQAEDGTKLFKPYLIPDLARFATEGRCITICFDYETRQKQRRELDHEIEKIKQHFGYQRAKVRVLELPGPEKGVDDYLVAHGGEAFIAAFDAAPTFELWTVQRYSRLSYAPDLDLNQRYLGDMPIPESAKLIGLKSPKGTGKTHSFRSMVEAASAYGQRTLLITHRVQLGQAICDRVCLPYVTELRTTEEGDLLGYGVCVDSLHPNSQARFNAADWDDALVIIDEAEQVIWHLLEGRTEIKNNRLEVLNQLQQLFNGVLNSERGRIVLSDADLSDQSIRFVLGMVDAETKVAPFVVVNRWRPHEPWQVFNYAQNRPEQWLAALLDHCDSGGKPFVCTQSQKTKSRWSTTTLETLFKERYPDRRVLRIDSQSVADPQHPAYNCTASLDQVLSQYDIVIASPTIETGVSIDLRGHFTSVWGCAQGVLSENSTRQFLSRVREPVPRHIWSQSFGVGRIGNGGTSVKGLLAAEYKLAKKHAQVLKFAAFGEDMLTSYSPMLSIWASMACRINAGAVHYREAVLHGLREEGHLVEDASPGLGVEVLKADLDTIKLRQHREECEAISEADSLTESEYKKLKGKKAKTKDQWHQERCHEVAERYGVDVTPELVGKDSDGWYPQLRLFYYLTVGRSYLNQRDHNAFEAQTSSGGAWLPTLNRSQLSLKIAALEYLGIRKLMDTEERFNGGTRSEECEVESETRQHYDDCHPVLWEVAKAAHQFSWELRAVLGITISERMSPIQIAQALLKKIGVKLTCLGQVGGRGDRQRLYSYSTPSDGRDAIIGRWGMEDSTRNESAVHTPGNKDHYSQEVAA